jgi:acetyl-CoA C-acetyltransferase
VGPQSPVIVGVGQLANKDDDRVLHPLDLIEAAVRAAVDDAGADPLDRVGAVLCPPASIVDDLDVPALLAERLGLAPGLRRQSAYSGSGPQELLAEACDEIAAGRVEAALVAGGIADASVRRALARGEEPPAAPTAPWSQGSGGGRPLDPSRFRAMSAPGEAAAGVLEPVASFAMAESVLAAAAGRSVDQQRVWLGELMAPFTEVAARRPEVAWFPTPRTPEEISTVSPANRLVCGPYTKLMTSFPTVDLAAAVLVTSEELADRLGVPEARRVRPWGAAACHEPLAPSLRPRLDRPPALDAAAARALAAAGIPIEGVDLVDVYSCFPAAVQMGAAALGLPPGGTAATGPLTQTGGLPYFGGPGASYTAHAIACMVEECRARPGAVGLVLGIGGLISGFAAGAYSTAPSGRPWAFDRCTDVEAALEADAVAFDADAEGTATVEAMTVFFRREGPVNAPVFVRWPDGRRSAARPADPGLAAALASTSLVGRPVRLSRQGERSYYEPV